MDSSAPPKALPDRFQRAKTKLFIASGFGGMIVGIMSLAIGSGFAGR